MKHGHDRAVVSYVWPRLERESGRKLLYLDLMHWVALARAQVGHPDGAPHRELLSLLVAKRDDVQVVLSAELYMEMWAIRSTRRRFELAEVMEAVSGFAALRDLSGVVTMELDAGIQHVLGGAHEWPPQPLLVQGVLPAFGRDGTLRVVDRSGGDRTAEARGSYRGGPDAFDRVIRDAQRMLARNVLRGPADARDEAALRSAGWDPFAAKRVAEQRAAEESAQAERFAQHPTWRRGRVRDVVAARFLALDVLDEMMRATSFRGTTIGGVVSTPVEARLLVDAMPSVDAQVTLRTAKHRSTTTKWRSNDIFDLDALSRAIAYCDVVVTEQHIAHLAHAEGLADRAHTTVLSDLTQLAAVL